MRMLLYNNGSRTGKEIALSLGANIQRSLISRKPIINWGAGMDRKIKMLPEKWLNKRGIVDIAKSKLLTFRKLKDFNTPLPDWTTIKGQAKIWAEDGCKVYCRTLTRSNQGKGIVIATNPYEVVNAPLYTKKVNANREYRVHVFQSEILGVQRKITNEEINLNQDIRNHRFGWVFSLRNIERVHEEIKNLGIEAVNNLGLDFGAVDLLWNKEEEKGYILEVNTAPSIEFESTIYNNYITKFKNWYLNGGN